MEKRVKSLLWVFLISKFPTFTALPIAISRSFEQTLLKALCLYFLQHKFFLDLQNLNIWVYLTYFANFATNYPRLLIV